MNDTVRSGVRRSIVAVTVSCLVVACSGDDDDTGPTTAATVESTIAEAAVTAAASAAATTVVDTTASPTTVGPPTSAAPAGVTFTSAEGDYSAVFPSEPAQQTQRFPLPDGGTIDIVLAGVDEGGTFISTARGRYPDGYQLDVARTLQAVQDQTIAALSGTLVASRDISLQGRSGRELSAAITSDGTPGTLLGRFYLDGLVIYQAVVSGPGTLGFEDPDVARFFGSFAFTTG